MGVNELLCIFKDALTAMAPIAERAHITFKDGEAYDDWDRICDAIFTSVVTSCFEYATETSKSFYKDRFAKYGFIYPTYADLSFLRVTSQSLDGEALYAFHEFSLYDGVHFEVVCLRLVGSTLVPLEGVVVVKFEDCDFSVDIPSSTGTRKHFSVLSVN